MACDALTFTGVDRSKLSAVRETVEREYGIRIDSDHGQQAERGFTLKWDYDPAARTLRIQCTGKPFIVPCAVVNKRIRDLAGDVGIASG